MIALTHDDGHHQANWYGRLLVAWVLLGPVIGILYGWYADTRTWDDLIGLPLARQDDIQVMYYVSVAINYILGAFIWGAGILVLGYLALRDSDPPA
jgi:hypothetical protein